MADFESMVNAAKEAGKQSEEYLNSFFVRSNLKDYQIPEEADRNEKKAIGIMFRSMKPLKERVESAMKEDPLCLEAFFVYFVLSEDVYVDYRFDAYLKQASSYADLNSYQKMCYLRIMDFYVDFLLDLHNMTKALRIQKLIIRLSNHADHKAVSRLSFIFSILEDDLQFYRLYLDHPFTAYDYLLLLITLLKHEDEIKAKEVLIDMFEQIPESTYLDHLWDLDMEDEQQKKFYQVIEDCYDEISSIPSFFSWVNEIREKIV